MKTTNTNWLVWFGSCAYARAKRILSGLNRQPSQTDQYGPYSLLLDVDEWQCHRKPPLPD